MTITDSTGLIWTRSADGTTLTCSDGRQVIGNPEMTNEYLLSCAELTCTAQLTDAERIAQLEAKLNNLLNK
jgi:hypothetical protein